MKRAVGIFLSFSAILTYLKIEAHYYPLEEKITLNGVTTVIYNYPSMYWVICVILLITFILGIYLILAKNKQPKEYPLYDISK
ncbi:hypothetical protein [Lederbergia lenta]|uniref:Uncharacterized protein n=2 Tax=Lederbergia lenta TaxID=1467 RepID=A0A2X4ZH90_LEDLE|nr:hypothetical protein [Lederbergia lenta]MCM3109797.1 hypothetical protein [Lederbergia lenta]MEC2324453.1 hypothetical protein [Lederbergia lenta]SQI59824.1 Uncharacterised protein [Lederbergia lenta]